MEYRENKLTYRSIKESGLIIVFSNSCDTMNCVKDNPALWLDYINLLIRRLLFEEK